MKKAIFFDIDGTLIDYFHGITEISPRVTAAIKQLQSEGHYVFVATGRPYAFIPQFLRDFGFDGFVLANGAQAVLQDVDLFTSPLDPTHMVQFIEEFENHQVQYILEGRRDSFLKACFKEFYAFYDSVGVSRQYLKEDYIVEDLELFKIELLCPNAKVKEACMAFLDTHTDYMYFQSVDERSLEICHRENTKAAGILKVLEHLGIPVENSYAFGDGTNDVEMLDTVGCGIAMGNASDAVKAHADVITDTVFNDGVAVGIEQYVLGSLGVNSSLPPTPPLSYL